LSDIPAGAASDPLHTPGSADSHWSTDNVGEAAPGVLTPLSASIWADIGDRMPRRIAYAMGVFDRAARDGPLAGEDPIVRMFYGRIAMRMEYLATVGDRMPGTNGEDTVRGLFGRVPETMTFAPSARRYPVVAWRLPIAMLTAPRGVRTLAPQIDAWWRSQIARLPGLDLAGAIALFKDALERFDRTITVHTLALLSALQPLLDGVTKLVERTGVGDVGSLSGTGGAEMAIVGDIWRASRGQLTVAQVIAAHGFHGPLEGEISSRVWREDPAPLERMVGEYCSRPEPEDPALRVQTARRRLSELQRQVTASVPAAQRPAVRILLRLAARNLPLRGVGKRSFLQSMDVARGAARRAGELLAADGRIEQPDDVFYLVKDELMGALPLDAKELVAQRRERRAFYQQLELPGSWRGTPVPERTDAVDQADDVRIVNGIGVSAGTAEGIVRVVTDPNFVEVENGEVLVAPTTDPSWASIMFLSSALVVDIGGPLSHAAVVARELEVPCVVNTRVGTRTLRTGDRVRVDGSKGEVEVLERVAPAPAR
jgi:phosphohistidine swiveling domain-containing protein